MAGSWPRSRASQGRAHRGEVDRGQKIMSSPPSLALVLRETREEEPVP